jgi:prepilin-type N-terminal cleavage/methylation domain-containing protein
MLKNNKKGFTLIELLVVIAIIGILASIALVSLSSAQRSAKQARIVSDIQQIRSIAEAYKADKGSYAGFSISTVSEFNALYNDIATQGGQNINFYYNPGNDSYCFEVNMSLGPVGRWGCVNSGLALNTQFASDPGGCAGGAATTTNCSP